MTAWLNEWCRQRAAGSWLQRWPLQDRSLAVARPRRKPCRREVRARRLRRASKPAVLRASRARPADPPTRRTPTWLQVASPARLGRVRQRVWRRWLALHDAGATARIVVLAPSIGVYRSTPAIGAIASTPRKSPTVTTQLSWQPIQFQSDRRRCAVGTALTSRPTLGPWLASMICQWFGSTGVTLTPTANGQASAYVGAWMGENWPMATRATPTPASGIVRARTTRH